MLICTNCGTKVPEDALYCPTCGTPLDKRLLASVTTKKLDRIIDTLTKLTAIFLFSGAIPLLILVGQERELALDIWFIILGLLFLVVISCCILRLWYMKDMRSIPRDISDRTEFRYILTNKILTFFGFVAIFSTFGAVLAFHLFNNEIAAMYLVYILLSTAIIALVFTIVMLAYFLLTKKGRALLERDLKNVSDSKVQA